MNTYDWLMICGGLYIFLLTIFLVQSFRAGENKPPRPEWENQEETDAINAANANRNNRQLTTGQVVWLFVLAFVFVCLLGYFSGDLWRGIQVFIKSSAAWIYAL